MKKVTKSIIGILAGFTVLFAVTAFIISDPKADYVKENINLNDQVSLSEIMTENSDIGTFKCSLKFKLDKFENSAKEFYGQEIIIAGNLQIDRIFIGVTNNLISRVEIWNQNEQIETKELGFMDKMTWGESQTLSVDFYDQTNKKYKGKSKVSFRFYGGTGFFGDIGTINVDLTKYGDLSGNKSIRVFAKSIESNNANEPEFSDFRIWKNYQSFD
jgi:hypothetical protein